MYGRVRELYDRSKFLKGSKLKAEAEALYHLARKRIMLKMKGVIATGQNFVGKVRELGSGELVADLIRMPQPNGVFGINVRMPRNPTSVNIYSYREPFKFPAVSACGHSLPENYAWPLYVHYPVAEPTLTSVVQLLSTGSDSKGSYEEYSNTVRDSSGNVYSTGTHKYYPDQRELLVFNSAAFIADNGGSFINYARTSRTSTVLNVRTGRFFYNMYHEFNTSFDDELTTTINLWDLPVHQSWLACKELWDSQETQRVQAANDYNTGRVSFYRTIVQLSSGEVLYDVGDVPYNSIPDDIVYPDSVPPVSGNDYDQIDRHREWRLTSDNDVYSALDAGGMPNCIGIATMQQAPFSRLVGMGSRWDGYSITQTSTTVGSGVGQTLTYARTLKAKNVDGTLIDVAVGTAVRTTVNATGFARYFWDFDNFPAILPLGITTYIKGNYSFTSPENTNIVNTGDFSPNAFTGAFVVNGFYDSLSAGVSSSSAASYASQFRQPLPAALASGLEFVEIDVSDLADDELSFPDDTNKNGAIDTAEKSATAAIGWYGKGLSDGELLTVYPLSYIAQGVECGMFPQAYDIAMLTSIRIYGGYKFKYMGGGEFEFIRYLPITNEDGEQMEYEEFPFESTSLLGGFNAIVVANGTVYDDVLNGNPPYKKDENADGWLVASSIPSRARQKVTIEGQYEADMAAGKITLNGLYEWCVLNTTLANQSQ